MIWFDVLLRYWSRLSAEMQEKVRRYYLLCTITEQHGGRFMPEHVRKLEQELQTEARKFGWRD
ncbi:MAG: hypothetical protein HYZ50_05690 [Deltaproteobacteria bacterium]|nr:hypothetical protein [Deltaproteobacteria bacterium]